MKKKYILLLIIAFVLIIFCGCAGSDNDAFAELTDDEISEFYEARPAVSVSRERPPHPSETPGGEAELEGYAQSRLTGLPVLAQTAGRRPIAAVINNIYRALPQSGIPQADIIYEVLAEGNITRLVAIFQDYSAPKIGPVRSARDYFLDFAMEYDAIFVHHGGSPSGYTRLKETAVNRLDGLTLEGRYFWRDRAYPGWSANARDTRPMEHSSYTGGEKLSAAIEEHKFRDTLLEDADFGFAFNPVPPKTAVSPTPAEGFTEASVIAVPFSKEYTRKFAYGPETRVYTVSNRDGFHMDAETGEPLTVSNIIVQLVSMRVIPGDDAGRRDVRMVGAGEGFLITQGGYRPVKWSKAGHSSPTRWQHEDGAEIRLTPGKTWICVLQDSALPEFGQ